MMIHSIIIITISSADLNTDCVRVYGLSNGHRQNEIGDWWWEPEPINFSANFLHSIIIGSSNLDVIAYATKSMATVCKFKHLALDNLIFNKVRHGVSWHKRKHVRVSAWAYASSFVHSFIHSFIQHTAT